MHIITVNCAEMFQDGPGQPAYAMLALNVDFNGARLESLR